MDAVLSCSMHNCVVWCVKVSYVLISALCALITV